MLIRRGAWEYLLSAAKAGKRLRVELPDQMGALVALLIEGPYDLAVWIEGNTLSDQVELLGLNSVGSTMDILPTELQAVWERHYKGVQIREEEFLDVLRQVSQFLEKGFPPPDWTQER